MSDAHHDNTTTGSGTETPLAHGVAVINGHLRHLPDAPGVYRMLDGDGNALYVGKAKSLPKRVVAYTHPARQSIRIQRMIAQTRAMEFVTTHTEAEALLLEANLIKKLAPRYNILLRDDKSFPSILVTGEHAFPQVLKHRGARKKPGEYFGPFASAWAVNHTLAVLQRAFLLRSCSDSVLAARTRPCLLYQIKRCCAPCVNRISAAEYSDLVDQARDFLRGDSKRIQENLAVQMQHHSDDLNFEKAAELRDRIRAMTSVQAHQGIHLAGLGDADVIAAHQAGGQTGIQVFFFRSGSNYGNRAYFPSHGRDTTLGEVLEAFVGQFYANKAPPRSILLSAPVPEPVILAEALSVKAGHKVQVHVPQRGDKRQLVEHARTNAREALERRLSESASQRRLLEGLSETLGLDGPPERIEVYDNSHVSGTNCIGAMIVAGPDGFVKSAYRKFNIRFTGDTAGGDDYAMMREVLTRRLNRALKEDPDKKGPADGRWQWPDLILVDGGRGQLNIALDVFADLGIEDIALAGVAKGAERNAGRENIYLPDRPEPIILGARDPVLYFIQRLRDEAHRFAIGTHRDRRAKAALRSALDGVPGIGAKRKRALLLHFGTARAVGDAGLADLGSVEGISRAMAKKIYDHFHGGN